MSRTLRRQIPNTGDVKSPKNRQDKSCGCRKCGKQGRHGQGYKDTAIKLFFNQQLKEFIG